MAYELFVHVLVSCIYQLQVSPTIHPQFLPCKFILQDCVTTVEDKTLGTSSSVRQGAKILRVVKVLRILKIARILKAFKLVE